MKPRKVFYLFLIATIVAPIAYLTGQESDKTGPRAAQEMLDIANEGYNQQSELKEQDATNESRQKWSERILQAEQLLADDDAHRRAAAKRYMAAERYLQRTQELFEIQKLQFETGRASQADLLEGKYRVAQAKHFLEDAASTK